LAGKFNSLPWFILLFVFSTPRQQVSPEFRAFFSRFCFYYSNNPRETMDIAAAATGDANLVVDTVGNRCQKLFQDFLEEWQEGDELKYLKQARELVKPEKSTLVVSMKDVERFNSNLVKILLIRFGRNFF
jgi:hypothetical protein